MFGGSSHERQWEMEKSSADSKNTQQSVKGTMRDETQANLIDCEMLAQYHNLLQNADVFLSKFDLIGIVQFVLIRFFCISLMR